MGVLRSIGAVLLGLIVNGLVVSAIEAVGHRVYPLPPGLDTSDMKALAEAVKTMPAGAIAFPVVAWGFGALCGGFVAGIMAGRSPMLHAQIVGSLVLIMSVMMLGMLPSPAWSWIVALIWVPLGTMIGALLAAKLASEPAPPLVPTVAA